ncbi:MULTISPECIES: NeuD/PglB/VioB family sugar acetyltransferase [Providencia]|uniref:NeuD/PglB/VioB family sugar acetyltransferase n=1 Tax=Providencia TaxID=586 RepID=UPI0018E41A2D|nr:NeuD/PglB/VioB family sugar acetyltransferase [Providencia rettgeri]MBI6191585.1 NeuD/PglB/VioB family sugar acetyltransferase [Providencia rettgeri]MDE4734558.1 NeuD/PglB/VioB family sugar acetyltransferase [Providencia rettgeri]
MTKKKLIIIGAGGFSKSIIDSLDEHQYILEGFIDSYKTGTHQGYPIISQNISNIHTPDDYVYFIGIGDPIIRHQFLVLLKENNLELINIIDSTAILSKSVNLGSGIYIGKMSIINSGTTILDGAVINTRALIEHGNTIGICSNISTNVVLNGDVNVGHKTFIGSCTVVNGQIDIGERTIIGSGSVVIRNIPNNVVVAGSPTRLIRENIE